MSKSKPDLCYQLPLIPLDLLEDEDEKRILGVKKQREIDRKQAFQVLEENPPVWFEEYQKLVEAGWHWRMAAYMAWSATPRKLRWPKTQAKLAVDVLGLNSQRQFCKWRSRIPAMDDLICALRLTPMLEYRADVIDALINSAIVPDPRNFKDRRMFLEITGDYVPAGRQERDIQKYAGSGVMKKKSDEELEKLLKST